MNGIKYSNKVKKIFKNKNYQKIFFLIIILLIFIFLMKWFGINFLQLMLLFDVLFLQFLIGIIVFKPIDSIIECEPLKILLSLILGISISGFVEFIFNHKEVYILLKIKNFEDVSWVVLGLCIVLIITNIKYIKVKLKEYICFISKNNINFELLITLFALILSIFIVFNFSYDDSRNFGAIADKTWHLFKYPKMMIENNGFPIDKTNFGVVSHIEIYSFILGLGKLKAVNFIKANGFYGTISLALFIILIYYFCKYIFYLNSKNSIIISVCTLFFGAINWPLFRLIRSDDGEFITSYLGFFNSSSSLYHNTTQQYSILLVIASYILISLFIITKNKSSKILTYSAIFAILSFFIKQSAFIFLGPIIFIMAFYKLIRTKKFNWLISIFVIIIPIIFQVLYFYIFKVGSIESLNPQIDFLGFYYIYFFEKYPFLKNMYLIASFIILIRSFGGLILPTVFSKYNIDKRIIYLNNITFIYTFLFSAFLVEGTSSIRYGNFSWTFAAFFILYVPYLFKITFDIEEKKIRYIAFSILGLHIVGGLLHLIAITVSGALI